MGTFKYEDLTIKQVQAMVAKLEPSLDNYDVARMANFIMEVKFCAYSKGMRTKFLIHRKKQQAV